jgi:Transposase, Mutator family
MTHWLPDFQAGARSVSQPAAPGAGTDDVQEEALIEMYLAGVSVRRVEDITEALWGTRVSPSTVSNLNKKIYGTIEAWRPLILREKFLPSMSVLARNRRRK